MIEREISKKILELAGKFPVLAVIGPRQSGKTTLVKHIFPDYSYFNLEEPDTLLFAKTDPRAFLRSAGKGIIIDEAQRLPELFSYIQSFADNDHQIGKYILTGSQNFLLSERISQSLAGRVALFTLMPFTAGEIFLYKKELQLNDVIFYGSYPAVYERQMAPGDWFPNYIQTYIERDVRQIKNITNLSAFISFLKLCAGRVGQLLNLTSLANDTGVSVNTVKSWLSALEASYIIFLLKPHYQNFSKRLIKMPKLYFVDTGLALNLLGVSKIEMLRTHYLYGSLFENFVISELLKQSLNAGLTPALYFWRDKPGHEIDCLIDNGVNKTIIEIKASQTIIPQFYKNIEYYTSLAKSESLNKYVIYAGDSPQQRTGLTILPWRQLTQILPK